MNQTTTSIIVPCYNVETYLTSFMEGISQQRTKDFEVIFVDDGSTDNTLSVLRKFQQTYSYVQVIEQTNQGAGAARNTGLKYAKGKYVCFFDPDDRVSNHLIEKNIDIMKAYRPDVLVFGIGYIDESGRILKKTTTLKEEKDIFIQTKDEWKKKFERVFFQTSIFSPCNKIYLREFLLVNELTFPKNRTGQDSLFNIEVLRKLPTLFISPEIHYYYQFGRPGSAAKKFDEQRIKDDMEICRAFAIFVEDLGLKDKYVVNLTFQKAYKLFSRIKHSQESKDRMYQLLFSQEEIKKQLPLWKIYEIYGQKNKLRYMYLVTSCHRIMNRKDK